MRPLLALLLVAAFAAGCGSTTGQDRPGAEATLLLDFTPNAVHSGLYMATERGYDAAEGVELEIRKPGASTDALKLLQTRRADMAILDIHDLGLARQEGRDVVGVMALVQRPLAAVFAQPSIRSPAGLEGERAGVSGLPSDEAVLRSVVAGDGGDPSKVRPITIGFQAVKALLARRVAGATAFWNVEGVALREQRPHGLEPDRGRAHRLGVAAVARDDRAEHRLVRRQARHADALPLELPGRADAGLGQQRGQRPLHERHDAHEVGALLARQPEVVDVEDRHVHAARPQQRQRVGGRPGRLDRQLDALRLVEPAVDRRVDAAVHGVGGEVEQEGRLLVRAVLPGGPARGEQDREAQQDGESAHAARP